MKQIAIAAVAIATSLGLSQASASEPEYFSCSLTKAQQMDNLQSPFHGEGVDGIIAGEFPKTISIKLDRCPQMVPTENEVKFCGFAPELSWAMRVLSEDDTRFWFEEGLYINFVSRLGKFNFFMPSRGLTLFFGEEDGKFYVNYYSISDYAISPSRNALFDCELIPR